MDDQAFLDRREGRPLEVDVEGGLDPEALVEDDLAIEALEEQSPDLFREISRDLDVLFVGMGGEDRWCGELALVGLLVDITVAPDPAEHVAAARLGGFGVAAWVVGTRALDEPGEQGGLGDGELLGGLAEIAAGGLADSPGAVAEIDLIQIEVEDLVLAELLLDPAREDDLTHLALVGALRSEQQALDHLLGDRAGALGDAAFAEVGDRGPQDRGVVDSLVLEEGSVLGGDESELDVAGNLVDRHEPTLFCVELSDQPSFSVEDFAHDRGAVIVETAEIGEVADQDDVDRECARSGTDCQECEQRDEDTQDPTPAPPRPEKSHVFSEVAKASRRAGPCATDTSAHPSTHPPQRRDPMGHPSGIRSSTCL